MTAQINATGTIASVALDIPFGIAVYVGLASILICSMLGGNESCYLGLKLHNTLY